jgi:hypothetical protein
MRVSVKLVVFRHPKSTEQSPYCGYSGYCPQLTYFVDNQSSVDDVVSIVKRHLHQELCHRIRYKNLQIRGWEVSENSAIPPIFTDEEVVHLAEQLYEVKIVEPQIIELNVRLPNAQNLW